MPINEDMHIRLLSYSKEWPVNAHRKMFGGVCYMLNGNMVCGIHKEYYIFRVGQEQASHLLANNPNMKPFDITGRPMKGWVMIHNEAVPNDTELKKYVDLSRSFVESLPPK